MILGGVLTGQARHLARESDMDDRPGNDLV